jgi:ABC-2 type transport system permease protein
MLSTIYIMWLREMKRYTRSRSRILGSLGQPLFFLLSFGFGFSAVFKAAGQGSYIDFLAPGIIGMSIIFTSIFNGMQVIWDRQFGFLKETLVAPVPRLGIMIGRTLGGATVSTLQGCIVLLMTLLIGFRPVSWGILLPTVLVMLLIGLIFSALGIAMASSMRDMQGFQLVMNFLVMPLFFLSGALFPLTNAPAPLVAVASLDPLSYGVDAMRALLIGVSHFGLTVDLIALFGFAVVFLGAGSYLFRKIEV